MVLLMSKFVFKRVMRDVVSLGILFITPLVLITIMGIISDGAIDAVLGIKRADSVALSMMLAFQLFAGFYTLELMMQDLIKARQWRMKSLPIQLNRYMYAIITVTTLYSALQGFAITRYTQLVYGVMWGHPIRLIFGLLLLSLTIQLMYLNLALYFKQHKTMERVATTAALVSMFFGGVWFQLPSHPILNFMGTYGNLYSVAQNFFLDGMKDQMTMQSILSIIILLLLIGFMILISEMKGRRLFK